MTINLDSPYDRRAFMGYFTTIGLGASLLPGVLWAQAAQQGGAITVETIKAAEEIIGMEFTDAQRTQIAQNLAQTRRTINAIRAVPVVNAVQPVNLFNPLPDGFILNTAKKLSVQSPPKRKAVPSDEAELAFLPITELSGLIRAKKITPTQLTNVYLARLKKYNPLLNCVVTLLEERALAQAKVLDAELASGKYRGPLHGIPWGAKDLLAVKGAPTTWGTVSNKDQVIDADATVVQRLDAAGAILVAKLATGELALNDVWFGGRTNNPWNPAEGSSGSSAGPASATAGGLVVFGIGSETQGSISSPSTRCGTTGLRPTFGFVPKTNAMALAWSMDKLGPLCRSAEDCALVLSAIHGPDGRDRSVQPAAFNWDYRVAASHLRVGYVKSAFDAQAATGANGAGGAGGAAAGGGRGGQNTRGAAGRAANAKTLEVLQSIGAKLIPVDLPASITLDSGLILDAESGAAFDAFLRSGHGPEMATQSWPSGFRRARFITAVDYINANRVRALLIEEWAKMMTNFDVLVMPTGTALGTTNLTGHPALILPNGFAELTPPVTAADSAAGRLTPRPPVRVPVSITFVGQLYEDAKLCALGRAYQDATDFHTQHPTLVV
jgi:Asp-tRNA(Asn)/Glu-tRNA(Gln) amidotransferase A subunit family amidase